MERKNTIKISFEPSYFSQIFIHTSGSYMRTLVNKNNNRYLSNFKDDWYDEEFGELILELENGPSESRKQEILSRLKILANTQTRVNPIPLSFGHNIEELYCYIVFEPTSSIEHYDLALLDFISYDFNVFNDYLLFFINFGIINLEVKILIYTVTFNPAIDYVLKANSFEKNKTFGK